MQVQQILNAKDISNVVTARPEMSLLEVSQLLAEHRIGAVVISSDAETLEGILSERDIVRATAKNGAAVLNASAAEWMTKDIVSCKGEDRILTVLEKMTAGRFRHMPVLEDDKLKGVISIGDAVKARLDELSMQKDALEGMIMGH